MDRSLYIAMSGAKQTLLAQASNANNLANAQTTGFKADFEQFRSMPVFGPGFPARVYAMTERPGTDLSAGSVHTTGNDLDVAIKGQGWLVVEGQEGREAYTRAGDLRITPDRRLQTGNGLSVFGNNGPITIPAAEKVDIANDGTISVVPLGETVNNLVIIDRIKLVSPELANLDKRADGLMYTKDGLVLEADATVNLVQGALEGANVNTVSALVEMIELARHFELQTKVMKNADDNSSITTKLMQMA